jgi:hypothetical protein
LNVSSVRIDQPKEHPVKRRVRASEQTRKRLEELFAGQGEVGSYCQILCTAELIKRRLDAAA